MLSKLSCAILFLLTSFSFGIFAKEKIHVDVYVYHLKPPFILSHSNKSGLYYDFSTYLNSKSDKYYFETMFVPRKRIESMLDANILDGIILGVNPIWFKDKTETKYLWTKEIFKDQDEVVSLVNKAIEYTGKNSLNGNIMGGVRGFYYVGLDEEVEQGNLVRHNTIGEEQLLQMLLLERVDFAIISNSTLKYLMKTKGGASKLYLSKKPHFKYNRRVLVPHDKKAIYDHLELIIRNIDEDPLWKQVLDKY